MGEFRRIEPSGLAIDGSQPAAVERGLDVVGYLAAPPARRDGLRIDLMLAPNFPLSHLRARTADDSVVALARYLIEERGPVLRHTVPVVFSGPDEVSAVSADLDRAGATAIFPALESGDPARPEVLGLLETFQIRAYCGSQTSTPALKELAEPASFAGIRMSPIYELGPSQASALVEPLAAREYWDSEWAFDVPPAFAADLWRVRPNLLRAGVRGEYVVVLARASAQALGRPPYVVISNPYFPLNYLPAFVIVDPHLDTHLRGNVRTVYVDRSVREGLGISDGEHCRVEPWDLRPGLQAIRRWTYRRGVGPRTLIAHSKVPLKSDTEKPVCRMSRPSLEAIGAQAGGFVTLEVLKPDSGAPPGLRRGWAVKRVRQRVLEIDISTAQRRARWEGRQTRGYVDCAAMYAIFPEYPDIYLDFFTRADLGGVPPCGVVQVRAAILSRVFDDAGEFAWLGVIAFLAAIAATLSVSAWVYPALAAAVTVILVLVRVRRSVR